MQILIIAGPNGAGKTTFAKEFLPAEAACREFVNADNIAAGISPYAPESVTWQASRLMLERIRQLSAQRLDFALETTLSTRSYLNHITGWQANGYSVHLHFLRLPDADWAVRRVAERVKLGGHNIPEATIRRRYERGYQNFQQLYKQVVDSWTLYDSSTMPPRDLDSGKKPTFDSVEEPPSQYGGQQTPKTATNGALAALTRAAEKAIARARAAGLEPIVRFETANKDASSKGTSDES